MDSRRAGRRCLCIALSCLRLPLVNWLLAVVCCLFQPACLYPESDVKPPWFYFVFESLMACSNCNGTETECSVQDGWGSVDRA
jgi:hypothetical protein